MLKIDGYRTPTERAGDHWYQASVSDRIQAGLDAVRAMLEGGLPMEIAPKDGTHILGRINFPAYDHRPAYTEWREIWFEPKDRILDLPCWATGGFDRDGEPGSEWFAIDVVTAWAPLPGSGRTKS